MSKYKIIILLSLALAACACSNTNGNAPSPTDAPTVEWPTASSLAAVASPANDLPAGKTLDELVPKQWQILANHESAMTKGLLNADEIDDIAVVLEAVHAEPGVAPKRALLLALGMGNDLYAEGALNEAIVYSSDEGGVFGDPLVGVGIRDATVFLEHYGGSNWRWSNSYMIDWRNEGWYAVGYSSSSEHLSSPYYEEWKYDAYFGDLIINKVNEDGTEKHETRQLEREKFIKLEQLTRESFDFIHAVPLTYESVSLGFSVTFPESWSDYYIVTEEGPTLNVFFNGESQISQQLPITSEEAAIYLFSIGPLEDAEAYGDLIDGVRKIGEIKGDDYYYYTSTDCSVCLLTHMDDLGEGDPERSLRESDYARYELMNADLESVLLSFTSL